MNCYLAEKLTGWFIAKGCSRRKLDEDSLEVLEMKKIIQENKFVLCFFLILFFVILYINITKPIAVFIQGTYYAEAGCYIAIDTTREFVFYFTDMQNNRYLKGTVIKENDNCYLLTCSNEDDKKYFPAQTLERKKNNKKIVLNIKGTELEFTKKFNALVVTGHMPDSGSH